MNLVRNQRCQKLYCALQPTLSTRVQKK